MKKKIYSMLIVSAMLLTLAGCGADKTPAEVPAVEQEVTVGETAEPSEEELEAQKEAEEAAKKAEEEEAAKKAEEERIAALRAEIDAIDTEALASEMTENGNEDGVSALTSLVESYTAGETDPDAFMESYKAILADKEAFDAEYIKAEEERKAAEEAKKAITIPDWFDAAYYAANNADVVAALGSSPEALYSHYTQFGKGEGRAAYEGDPNAVAKAESPAPAGEPAQTEGGATTQTPWGDLYVIYGEGWDSYFISEGAPGYAMVDELSNRVPITEASLVDWIFLGEMNGKHIRKYYVRPL